MDRLTGYLSTLSHSIVANRSLVRDSSAWLAASRSSSAAAATRRPQCARSESSRGHLHLQPHVSICILSNVVRMHDDRVARISRRSRTDIDLTHGASSIDSLCQSRIFIVVIRSDRFKQLLVYTTKNITIIANPIQSPIQSNPSESNGAHSC